MEMKARFIILNNATRLHFPEGMNNAQFISMISQGK
jgi:hypothetical protein